MNDDVLVIAEGVSKKYCKDLKKSILYGVNDITGEFLGYYGRNAVLRKGEFWAIDDVSFELKRGECLGLIGRNGAGKSTLLKMCNGLVKPDIGKITMRGRIGALIELGAGFNPILTGRENVYINGAVLGFSKKDIDKRFDAIVDFAELEEFIDMPVQSYSSGMKVRLGFAVAAQMDPDVLIIDEVLSVGDVGFRHKCNNIITRLAEKCAIIVVSHSLGNLAQVSTKILFLKNGRRIYLGDDIAQGFIHYLDVCQDETSITINQDRVTLHECTISGSHSKSNAIDYHEDLLFDIEFTVHGGHYADVIGLEIFNHHQHFISETFVKLDKENCTIDTPHRVKIRIPKMQLNTGKYYLTLLFCKDINGMPNGKFITQYRNIRSFTAKAPISSSYADFLVEGEIVKE